LSPLSRPESSCIVIDDLDPLVDDYIILGEVLLLAGIKASRVIGARKGGEEVVGACYWAPVY
jgi:hypothetical protein